MIVHGREIIVEFFKKHADSKGPLKAWLQETCDSIWTSPQNVKERYDKASILQRNVVVFDIKGNTYRLVVKIAYNTRIVLIVWVGTHPEYDKFKQRGGIIKCLKL